MTWAIKGLIALAIMGALSAVYFGIRHQGVVAGRAEVQADWDADKNRIEIAQEKAVADRIRENELEKVKFEADKVKLKKGNADEIAQIRAYYASAGRLRIPATVCPGSTGGSKTESTSGSGTTTPGTILLPEAIGRNLQDLARQADEMVAGCRTAQDFIKSQDMAP